MIEAILTGPPRRSLGSEQIVVSCGAYGRHNDHDSHAFVDARRAATLENPAIMELGTPNAVDHGPKSMIDAI